MLYIYIYYIYIYIITTLSVGCKQGGRTQNVSYSFDPLGKKSNGEGYLYVGPLLGPKTSTGRFKF